MWGQIRIFAGNLFWLSNILALSVPSEGYSRNASCTINLIFTFAWVHHIIKSIRVSMLRIAYVVVKPTTIRSRPGLSLERLFEHSQIYFMHDAIQHVCKYAQYLNTCTINLIFTFAWVHHIIKSIRVSMLR
jgi:succinate dehydrogenase/fumarate reductase cytochrome b subunit